MRIIALISGYHIAHIDCPMLVTGLCVLNCFYFRIFPKRGTIVKLYFYGS